MLIGGLQKISLLDYPDKISAIIFTAGCNFRCPYCHNPELVNKIDKKMLFPEQKILDFLSKRIKKIDAVVITGGEPTLHQDLPDFIKKIKKMDFLIKLDSNGTNPQMLKQLIKNNLLNYIAMDIKAPLNKYEQVIRMPINKKNIQESIRIIKQSGLDYEFRSTILPALHNFEDIKKMAQLIQGAKKYFLQNFIASGNLNDNSFNQLKSFTDKEMHELVKLCQPYVKYCAAR